ncbi:tetrathionate reductase subunit TtrA, partial [Vibrio sp. 10N.286.49.E1]
TIVTPSLPAGSSSLAAGDRNNWLPIKPGTDSALVLGMIQWIIENQRYNHDFLSRPSAQAMQKAGTTHWCNASHLVISDETHPQDGRMLRASDMGLLETGEPMSDDDGFIALDVTTSLISSHIQVNEAALFVDQDVEIDGQTVRVKSSLQRLKEEAFKYDLAYYSEQCEIPQDQII